MENSDKKKISRRTFLKKGKKLVYLTPAIYTFFTDSKEVMAQGRVREAALANRVADLERQAAAGDVRSAQALQRLRERLVSPP